MLSLRKWTVAVSVVVALATVSGVGAAQDVRHLEGKTGPGSTYVMDVPAAWNGVLVLYAHGIVPAGEPVAAPDTQGGYIFLREALLPQGYAVAASSFSSNGWALADAVQRTHQLRGLFVSKFGQPREIILAGHSLGALAIVKLAETYPTQYSGALAMCGPLGGGIREIRYAGDARVTFDYYFPGLLPGTPFEVPDGTLFYPSDAKKGTPGSDLFNQVYATLVQNPENWPKVAQWASAAELPFVGFPEMFENALYFIGFQLRYTNDLIERVNGKAPYENWDTKYKVNVADPDTNAYLGGLLNLGVDRYLADPAALNYYERNYEPTGDIRFPVVTLHTTRDAGVPIWHEDLFAKKVAAAGNADLLTQINVNAAGHCNFQPADMLNGWYTLLAKMAEGK